MICDDHKLFRKGIVGLLEDFDYVNRIWEAENGKNLLQQLAVMVDKPDLILLDLNMPEMDGIEATPLILKKYPKTKIIILSMEDDTQIVSHLVGKGVNGYLLKNADPDELELAIKMVIQNGFYFSGELSGAVFGTHNTNNDEKQQTNKLHLTKRELQTLQMICKELTAAEIGQELAIGTRTIEGYKRKLLAKTGTRNMAGLVMYAVKNGLVKI